MLSTKYRDFIDDSARVSDSGSDESDDENRSINNEDNISAIKTKYESISSKRRRIIDEDEDDEDYNDDHVY